MCKALFVLASSDDSGERWQHPRLVINFLFFGAATAAECSGRKSLNGSRGTTLAIQQLLATLVTRPYLLYSAVGISSTERVQLIPVSLRIENYSHSRLISC